MYEILFNLIGKVFLLIILGYCLRKWGVIAPDFHDKLNSFLMKTFNLLLKLKTKCQA